MPSDSELKNEHIPLTHYSGIEFKQICLSFEERKLFSNFSHIFEPESKTLIHGPNGSGKSTLLKLLLGFQQPDSGFIRFFNQELNSENIRVIRKQISYLPQNVHLGIGSVSTLFNELLQLDDSAFVADRFAMLLQISEKLSLPQSIFDAKFEKLSGGERQKLLLSLALAMDKKVMLFDEFNSALDKKSRNIVSEMLIDANSTLIAISHDPQLLINPAFQHLELEPTEIPDESDNDTFLQENLLSL